MTITHHGVNITPRDPDAENAPIGGWSGLQPDSWTPPTEFPQTDEADPEPPVKADRHGYMTSEWAQWDGRRSERRLHPDGRMPDKVARPSRAIIEAQLERTVALVAEIGGYKVAAATQLAKVRKGRADTSRGFLQRITDPHRVAAAEDKVKQLGATLSEVKALEQDLRSQLLRFDTVPAPNPLVQPYDGLGRTYAVNPRKLINGEWES